jgi:hypothetical protein
MRRLAFLLVVLSLAITAAPAAGASSALPPLPPLPHSRLLDQALPEHGPPVRPAPYFRSGFTAKAGKYNIGVSTYGAGLFLGVWRGDKKGRSMSSYLAKGIARPERLQATFGKLGRISMRFRPSRNLEPSKSCSFGRVLIRQHGVFVGSLKFRGEGGYVSIHLHRAKATILRLGKRCHVHRHHDFDPSDFEFLFAKPEAAMLAFSRDGVDSTAVLAIAAKKKSTFLAVDEESRGDMAIIRLAIIHRSGTLRFDESLTSGRLDPPAPFHGTGRYHAFPDGTVTWSGDLNIDFPGAPRFPLTGTTFEALVEVPF